MNAPYTFVYNARCENTPNRNSTLLLTMSYYPTNTIVMSSRGIFSYQLLLVFSCYDTKSLIGDIWVAYEINQCYDGRAYALLVVGVASTLFGILVMVNLIYALCMYRRIIRSNVTNIKNIFMVYPSKNENCKC